MWLRTFHGLWNGTHPVTTQVSQYVTGIWRQQQNRCAFLVLNVRYCLALSPCAIINPTLLRFFFICHCCWSWFITTRPCNIMEAITSISLSKRRLFYKITRQIVFPNVLIFCSLKGCLAAMLPQTSAKFQSIRKRQHSFPAHLRVGCYDKTSYVIYCLPITNIAFHFISTKGSLRDALCAFLNQLQRNRLVCESSCVTEHFPYDMLTISFTACWSNYTITRRWLYVIYWQSNL